MAAHGNGAAALLHAGSAAGLRADLAREPGRPRLALAPHLGRLLRLRRVARRRRGRGAGAGIPRHRLVSARAPRLAGPHRLPPVSLAHRPERGVPRSALGSTAGDGRDRPAGHPPGGAPDRPQPGRHARALARHPPARSHRVGGDAGLAVPWGAIAPAGAARVGAGPRASAERGAPGLLYRVLPLRGGNRPRDRVPGRGAAARGVHAHRRHRGLAHVRGRRPGSQRRGRRHSRGSGRQLGGLPGDRAAPGRRVAAGSGRVRLLARPSERGAVVTPPALNHRLTTLDATFLYTEKPVQPMHVGGSMLYEGRLSLEVLVRALECRLHLLPRYRQKVVFPPFAAAHPTWEDDPAFDIRHHVAEVTLPPPGDDRALSEVGGAAFAGMLDREHPLWKLIMVHGRADGNTAVIWKVHHAMIDGVSGVDLTMVLHDLKPDAAPPEPPAAPWQPRPLPDPLTLLQNAVRDRVTEVAQ